MLDQKNICSSIYVFVGPSCISSGHVEAAITSYKQALLLRPDFPEATCNLLHTLQVFIFPGLMSHVCYEIFFLYFSSSC